MTRNYTTRRSAIANSLVDLLKEIDGTGDYLSDVGGNVLPKLQFWDEIEEFPAIRVTSGLERRVYQGGGYKDRFLSVTVRCYVKDEEPIAALERLLEDVETVIEQNGRLAYLDSRGVPQFTHDITIVSIDTDEGALDPLGVGEILLQVHY